MDVGPAASPRRRGRARGRCGRCSRPDRDRALQWPKARPRGGAAALRQWLAPRPVRFYPSRGVAYESHLAPPAHLVGLRVAALDALLDRSPGAEAPVIVISAVALSEKVPDPALRPHGFAL